MKLRKQVLIVLMLSMHALMAMEGDKPCDETFEKTVKKTNPTLDAADLTAIAQYTGVHVYQLNQRLRSFWSFLPNTEATALNTALNKIPNFEGTVYRGTRLPQKVLEKYTEGAMIVDKAFVSAGKTRRVSDVYMNFVYPFSKPDEQKVTFIIESKTGKDVTPFSKFESIEEEVIFRTNTKFLVISKEYKGDFYEVRLKELP